MLHPQLGDRRCQGHRLPSTDQGLGWLAAAPHMQADLPFSVKPLWTPRGGLSCGSGSQEVEVDKHDYAREIFHFHERHAMDASLPTAVYFIQLVDLM